MKISYNKPVLNEDGSILIEQVSVLATKEIPNRIKVREIKVIQELYPDLKILQETISRAKANYEDVKQQGHKSVKQLDQEKKSLLQLETMLKELSTT